MIRHRFLMNVSCKGHALEFEGTPDGEICDNVSSPGTYAEL